MLAFKRLAFIAAGLIVWLGTAGPLPAATINLDAIDWSIQILIDQSETVLGQSQFTLPRDNRGLAISPDGRYLYAGYNNSVFSGGEVRRIDLTQTGNVAPFDARVTGQRGKSIAVDDVGRVYLAKQTTVEVYSADLSTHLGTISGLTNSEGVAVVRDGVDLVLYTSDRSNGTLQKRILTESGPSITGAALDATFGTSGTVTLAAGQDTRGVEIDSAGRIWVAGFGTDTLYRVSANGGVVDTITGVNNPMDIGFLDDTLLVTRYTDRLISRYDANTLVSLGSDLAPPWLDLFLDEDGQSSAGALSGIVTIAGLGFFVTNETGQTLTFEEPPLSGNFIDDNDPILFALAVPEPSSLALLLIGGPLLAAASGRRGHGVRKRRLRD